MNIEVIGDIYVRVSQQAGEYLHINAFVIAIRGECVPKDMLAPEFYPCLFTSLSRLVSQCLVREPFAIVIGENPFIPLASILFFQYLDCLCCEGDGSPASTPLESGL